MKSVYTGLSCMLILRLLVSCAQEASASEQLSDHLQDKQKTDQFHSLRNPDDSTRLQVEADTARMISFPVQVRTRAVLTGFTPGKILLETELEENMLRWLSCPAEGRALFEAYPEDSLSITLEEVYSPVTAEGKIRLAISVSLPPDDGSKRWMLGMHAMLYMIFRTPATLVVPRSALMVREGRSVLFRVNEGRSHWQEIRTGRSSGDWIEVLEGVGAGDTVVTAGQVRLIHDLPVVVRLGSRP